MSAMKKVVIAVISAFAAFAASAKVCVWTGGGGKWSESAKWENGETPSAGDIVDVRNGTAGAVIENDISGLVLSRLIVTGDAACELNGNCVTLTDANAFSNGVVNTVCSLPMVFTAENPYLYSAGAAVINGALTSQSAKTFTIHLSRDVRYSLTFNCEINMPNSDIFVMPNAGVNERAAHFKGKVVAKSVFKRIKDNTTSIRGNVYLYSPENEIGEIHAPYASIECKSADVMNGAVLSFGYCEADARAYYRIWQYNQTIDRIDGKEKERANACFIGDGACLTMAASASSYCSATFKGTLGLVWAPKADYELVFGCDRANTMKGSLTIRGGTAVLAGSASFKNVTGINVKNGASFDIQSSAEAAFEKMETLSVASGAKFVLSPEVVNPFTDGRFDIVAAADSEITVPEGVVISCKSFRLGATYVAGAAGYYTGSDNPSPGAAKKLSCLRGKGLVYVPERGFACTWLGGGGKWSDETKWLDGSVPGNAAIVTIANDVSGAVIENDLPAIALSSLTFTGSAPCTLTGEGVSLTKEFAVSNGVAGTVVSVPLNFTNEKPCVQTSGNITFGGDFSGDTVSEFLLSMTKPASGCTVTFNGELRFPNAAVEIKPTEQKWVAFNVNFNNAVAARSLCDFSSYTKSICGAVTLRSQGNAIGIIRAPYADISCAVDDVMRGAVLHFGQCENARARFLLGATDQTIDRFDGVIGGQYQGIVSGSGTLTMEATADSSCPARFNSSVDVIWAPKGDYTITFTRGQPHGTTGSLTVGRGTAVVSDGTSFSNLTALAVADGAKFTISPSAVVPFADDKLHIEAGPGSEISIPEGMTIRCLSFKSGGTFVSEEGYYTGYDVSDDSGIVKKLPCLRGKGVIYIPYRAAEQSAAIWTGGAGSDRSVRTAGNWSGGALPDILSGGLLATFATGGDSAVFSGAEKLRGIVLQSAGESFSLASDPDANGIGLYEEGLIAAAPDGSGRRYSLELPLMPSADQKWTIGSGVTLDWRGLIASGENSYPLTIEGEGAVEMRTDYSAFAGDLNFSGCAVDVYGFESAQETVNENAVMRFQMGADGKGASACFKGGVHTRPVICREGGGNKRETFVFDTKATNIFVSSFTFGELNGEGIPRPTFGGRTVFSGGLRQSDGYRLIPANENGSIIITNVPADISVGLQSDASISYYLYASNNNFGTYGVALNNNASFNCETDLALNDTNMPLRIGNSSKLYLNGHSQRIGSLLFTLTKGGWETFVGSRISNENAEPATLYFTQKTATTNSVTPIVGALNLSKSGPAEFAVDRAVAATGTLEVAQGRFAFTPKGTWAGATNVTVSGSGELSLSRSDTFARKVTLALSDDGRIALGEGVAQPVAGMTMDGLQCAGGTWGSSASGAENVDDARFSGTGVLVVRPAGLMVIIR